MAIRMNGEFEVARSREDVYAVLSNPQRFGPLLPDFQGLDTEDERNWTLELLVGVSQIRGTAIIKLHLAEDEAPRHALYTAKGRMAKGVVNARAGFDLEERDGGTLVKWTGEAAIFGKLTALAGGLLKPLAQKNIERLIGSLKDAMAG